MGPGNFLRAYERSKRALLDDSSICQANRELFAKFLDEEEYKLKRIRNLRALDDRNGKTLYAYIRLLKTTNRWFNNRAWVDLTREDIQRVYDALEDGTIVTRAGVPYKNLSESYYGKVIKSRPFELAGKLNIARDVIRYTTGNQDDEVRFATEETFRDIVDHVTKLRQRALLWVAFDYGENIHTLLQLRDTDFLRQHCPDTNEPEYRLNYRREVLKRSRLPRSDLSNYSETVALLDKVLPLLRPGERVFPFEYQTVKKMLDRAVTRAKAQCMPNGERVTFKDLRSGMACDLLSKDWTVDEVKARLGHRPSSRKVDKYVNYLAIGRHRPKAKVREFEVQRLKAELASLKAQTNLLSRRNEAIRTELEQERSRRVQMETRIDAQLHAARDQTLKEVNAKMQLAIQTIVRHESARA